VRLDCLAGHSFFADHLAPHSTVLDLGLNTGEFALPLIQRYGCRVVGVEPASEPLERLRAPANLEVEQAAMAEHDGTVELFSAEWYPTSVGELGQDRIASVRGLRLETLLDRCAPRIDLMKVDIEGAEFGMFDTTPDTQLDRIDQMTVEFHDFLDPSRRAHVEAIHARLRRLGFQRIRTKSLRRRNLDVIYLHRRRRLSLPAFAWIALRYRYARGAWRTAQRLLAGLRPHEGRP
jgi:FkbM family methyltransferase